MPHLAAGRFRFMHGPEMHGLGIPKTSASLKGMGSQSMHASRQAAGVGMPSAAHTPSIKYRNSAGSCRITWRSLLISRQLAEFRLPAAASVRAGNCLSTHPCCEATWFDWQPVLQNDRCTGTAELAGTEQLTPISSLYAASMKLMSCSKCFGFGLSRFEYSAVIGQYKQKHGLPTGRHRYLQPATSGPGGTLQPERTPYLPLSSA